MESGSRLGEYCGKAHKVNVETSGEVRLVEIRLEGEDGTGKKFQNTLICTLSGISFKSLCCVIYLCLMKII